MSFTGLSNFYAPPSRDLQQISQENVKPHVGSPFCPDRISTLHGTSDDEPDWEYPRDSVTKRRRHAVYLHRPPVWNPEPCPRNRLVPVVEGHGFPDVLGEDDSYDHYSHPENPHYHQRLHDDCLSGLELDLPDTSIGQISEEQTKFEQQLFCDITAAMAEAQAADVDVPEPDPGTPLPSPFSQPVKRSLSETNNQPDSPCSSADDSSNQVRRQDSFRQKKAGLCTRLQSYKDIRLEAGEGWAIQEGSLVVGIDPWYTYFDRQREHLADEFEITAGDFYIVCRLYADLWTLCIKISFDSPAENDVGRSSSEGFAHLGFVPLCAVTLAANFSSFVRRCSMPVNNPQVDATYPGNGLPVTPPERSHSLNASKQVFRGNQLDVGIPDLVYDACNILAMEGINMEFIPLDSTLQQLFSDLRGRRDRVHQLGKRMSLRKFWHETRSSESFIPGGTSRSLSFRDRNSDFQSSQATDQRQARRGRWSSFSSTPSQIRKWFPGMSSQVQLRQGIRDLMLTGSDKLRGLSRGNSTASDPLCYCRY